MVLAEAGATAQAVADPDNQPAKQRSKNEIRARRRTDRKRGEGRKIDQRKRKKRNEKTKKAERKASEERERILPATSSEDGEEKVEAVRNRALALDHHGLDHRGLGIDHLGLLHVHGGRLLVDGSGGGVDHLRHGVKNSKGGGARGKI